MESVSQMKSWYKTTRVFTKEETAYLKLLEEIFKVKNQEGQPIHYHMTDYQKEYHADSINIKGEDAEDILFVKARGISFSFSTCIEIIMSGLSFKNIVFPLITQRFEFAKELLKTCAWLIKNANININAKIGVTDITFTETGCSIKPFPSSSAADSVRGTRTIRCVLDEYSFQQRDRELLTAVQDTMQGSMGQLLIGSTPNGRSNQFYKLVSKTLNHENTGFKIYKLPVFDQKKFNPDKSIFEQNLTPIAPWINLKKLEKKRLRDPLVFQQEYMTSFLDDTIAFFPYSLISSCEDKNLFNYANKMFSPGFKYETQNPIIIAVDVARNTHLTAITAYEIIQDDEESNQLVQRLVFDIKQKTLPEQQIILEKIMGLFPSLIKVRIDMTGIGLGLYEYMKKKHGHIIEGVNFSSSTKSIRTGEPKQRVNIREFMIVNMKSLMENKQVLLIDDELQRHHFTMIDYSLKVKEDETGHGDYIFCNALALLPLQYKIMGQVPMATNKQRIMPSQSSKNPNELSLKDKIDWLKKQRRGGTN